MHSAWVAFIHILILQSTESAMWCSAVLSGSLPHAATATKWLWMCKRAGVGFLFKLSRWSKHFHAFPRIWLLVWRHKSQAGVSCSVDFQLCILQVALTWVTRVDERLRQGKCIRCSWSEQSCHSEWTKKTYTMFIWLVWHVWIIAKLCAKMQPWMQLVCTTDQDKDAARTVGW